MKKVILSIDGMTCSACSIGLEKYLNKQDGVMRANVNLVLAQALIEYDDKLSIKDLESFVKQAGFKSLGIYTEREEKKSNNGKVMLIIFGILTLFTLYVSMAHMFSLPLFPFLDINNYPINYALFLLVLTIPYFFYGRDIFVSGFKNLYHKSPNMDTLVMLGVLSSFIYSIFSTIMLLFHGKADIYTKGLYFESCATIIYFIKLGRFIDHKSKEKTKEALKELVQITPKKALKKKGSEEVEVTIDEIKKGDILICKPGMKMAVDGMMTKGSAHVDESFITGESLPVKKSKNDRVVAGSINLDGYIEYEACKIGKDSTISEMVRLVVEATNTKAPIQRLADKVSGYFVPAIIVIAFITFVIYLAIGFDISVGLKTFVTILVVACPCALGLATPLAIVVSEGLCAKRGILVKTSAILEKAHSIDTIVFDKTGTLTYGNLKIFKIYNYSKYTDDELIQKVASVETMTDHPIASAFKDYAHIHKLNLLSTNNFENISGIGLYATINQKHIYVGNNKLFTKLNLDNKYESDEKMLSSSCCSIVYVIENNKVLGLIGVKDIIRPHVRKTISKLRKKGKDIIMLTGDNEKTAKAIGESIGIDKIIASVMPQDKTKVIKELMSNGHKVMMVGDGINDAPSLATASVGVSVSGGTDIAADSSDVILMNNNIERIISLIDISQKTIRNIKQNLFWAFFYNICMLPLAAGLFRPFGVDMNPMFASFAMTLSSLTVVFNTLRLKKFKEKDEK